MAWIVNMSDTDRTTERNRKRNRNSDEGSGKFDPRISYLCY